MVLTHENNDFSNAANEELMKQVSNSYSTINDCAYVNGFSFNGVDLVALSPIKNVRDGELFHNKNKRIALHFCATINDYHNNVWLFLREPKLSHYYAPVVTVSFNHIKKLKSLSNIDTTYLSDKDLVNTAQKLLNLVTALLNHYKDNTLLMSAMYNLHGFFQLGSEIEELLVDDKGLLSANKHLMGTAIGSLTHYFITKAYDQYLNVLKNSDTKYVNEYYDRLLITVLNWSYNSESMINYFMNPQMFTNSSTVVSIANEYANNPKLSHNNFSLTLFYLCFMNPDNYRKFIETFDYPLHYLQEIEPKNIEKQALILIEKHNKMSAITKNVSKHPIMSNSNNDMFLHNDIKNTNASIVYSWAQIALGDDLLTHPLSLEILSNNETISDNTLEFLFSENILDYYAENPEYHYGVNNLIKKDLNNMSISYEGTILSTTDQIYGVDFFLPYIILRANNHFNHNISNNTIKNYYKHCIHTNLYVENDDYYDNIQYINHSIVYTIIGFLHDKEKLNNFLRAYPIISNFLYTNDNPKTIPLIINQIVNNENNMTNMLVNNEITMDHLVNIVLT